MKKTKKPLKTYIFPPFKGTVVSSLFNFLKRQKKLLTQRLKFYALNGKSVSIM